MSPIAMTWIPPELIENSAIGSADVARGPIRKPADVARGLNVESPDALTDPAEVMLRGELIGISSDRLCRHAVLRQPLPALRPTPALTLA
jgi:hypothetical protein